MKPRELINLDAEAAITEISIGPNGRIYIFGLSREVLDVVAPLCPNNVSLQARRAQLHRTVVNMSAVPQQDSVNK